MPEPDRGVAGRPVWVVVPTYDEADNVERLVAGIREHVGEPRRILIVDDDSPDGTGEIAERLAAGGDDLEVIHRRTKAGIGPAYVAGFRRALAGGAGLIVQMDADLSHDPADLPRLIGRAAEADLVLGSRYVEGGSVVDWGAGRRVISRGGGTYARLLLGVPIRDLTGGFKVFRREVLEAIDLDAVDARGYAFQVEVTYCAIRTGFRVVEEPITFRDRRIGNTKMSKTIVAEAAWRVPLMRLRRGR